MRIDVLGVGFDAVTMDLALQRAMALMAEPRPHYCVTPNAEICWLCHENKELCSAVDQADLVLADGIGIVKAARKLGRPLPERVAGYDFGLNLLPLLAKAGKRLYLLGGRPGVAEKAAKKLKERVPNLVICGTGHGYFDSDKVALREMLRCQPDVVYVCLGAPRQELWMAGHVGEVGHAFMVGLGGSFDGWAGEVKRAPAFFQKLGLEWLYRLISHPSRIGRMMAIPKFWSAVRRQAAQEKQP